MRLPGLRVIKTALSVVISAFIVQIIGSIFEVEISYFYACITAVFTMQQTSASSISRAKDRIWGTFIGAVVAIIIGYIRLELLNINIDMFFLFLGIVLCIYIVDCFNLKAGVMIACVMLIGSFCDKESYYVLYTFLRGFETLLGAFIAIAVNHYIFPYKQED